MLTMMTADCYKREWYGDLGDIHYQIQGFCIKGSANCRTRNESFTQSKPSELTERQVHSRMLLESQGSSLLCVAGASSSAQSILISAKLFISSFFCARSCERSLLIGRLDLRSFPGKKAAILETIPGSCFEEGACNGNAGNLADF